jgi:hypothetical protein
MSKRHPSAYPSNPGLEPDTGIPKDGKQFVKMLFNAKTKAEEAYRIGPDLNWKPVIYESQMDNMSAMLGKEAWLTTEGWLRENFEVIDNRSDFEDVQDSWDKIRRQLDKAYYDRMNMTNIAPQRSGKTWLGSQIEQSIIDERLSKVREVPDVRDIGYSVGPIDFNEKEYTASGDPGLVQWSAYFEGDAVQLKEWLQRRGICRRTLSCGMA